LGGLLGPAGSPAGRLKETWSGKVVLPDTISGGITDTSANTTAYELDAIATAANADAADRTNDFFIVESTGENRPGTGNRLRIAFPMQTLRSRENNSSLQHRTRAVPRPSVHD